ncbi:hypothetical protein KBZ12_13460 [Cyanobium sp. Cruz CV13-4-11]|uniref:hypothetical protein n=1 Tax=unclassified Cyanobium TaxID=2627006 RepID=UPI0020CFD5FB|nr:MULTISPECIES: hypothetical protein [unclassified Cyanobium]MCP9902412.1 hypothetical protein [Cyanobium sp. Cruz CV11-17]MCP9920464.1 hypothetical protein [Cyanobium sp. Cruz CV13-4-11]
MLSPDELQELEATLLPTLERHHLRLLAHGLRTLQAIAGQRAGGLPPEGWVAAWAATQPVIAADAGFAEAFLHQMGHVATQLAAIATASGREPLALDLADLVHWATHEADRRVRPPATPPVPPPG